MLEIENCLQDKGFPALDHSILNFNLVGECVMVKVIQLIDRLILHPVCVSRRSVGNWV